MALAYILLGSLACVVTCLMPGLAVIRWLGIEVNRLEASCLGFAIGSAIVSELALAMALLFIARKGVFLVLGILAIVLWRRLLPWFRSLPCVNWRSVPGYFRVLFLIAWIAYGGLYFLHGLEPETSSDGVSYHLGLVNLWNHAHGMTRLSDCYAALPQGIEMLFLFAFSIGRHSSAALVHVAFLMLLPVMMILYGIRFDINRGAAVFAAGVVFATPLVGWDGSVAYNDVALATVVFATIYMLQMWRKTKDTGTLLATGLLAGYCFSIKYTGAFVLLPIAGTVVWELHREFRAALRALVRVAIAAVVAPLPYLVRNWIWYRNPIAFFGNGFFPNPYFPASIERGYIDRLSHLGGVTWNELPRELTFGGPKLYYNLGPIYVLAAIALAGLFWRQSRPLLLAAVAMAGAYAGNKDPRFLIPMLPLAMLAAGFVLTRIPKASPVLWLLLAVQSAAAWPWFPTHARLFHVPAPFLDATSWRAALRLQSEDKYLAQFDAYEMARRIEWLVPRDAPVLVPAGGAWQSYTTHFLVDSYHSAISAKAADMFYLYEDSPTTERWLWTADFPSIQAREVKLVQAGRSPVQWSIGELRFMHAGQAIPGANGWRWTASPNPWDAGLMSDGLEVTRWRSWEPLAPGMYVGVRFDTPRDIDGIEMLLGNGPLESRLQVRILDDTGRWHSSESGAWHLAAAVDLRKAATQALKQQGIQYVVISQDTWHEKVFRSDPQAWGLRELTSTRSASLYRID